MNAGRQSLLLGEARQKSAERRGLLCGQSYGHRPIVLQCDPADRLDRRAAGIRKMDRIAPPIIRYASALDKAALLELVEEDDEAARENRELGAELLLADPFLSREHPEYPRMRRRKLELLEPFGELCRSMRSYLCQKECNSGGWISVASIVRIVGHWE